MVVYPRWRGELFCALAFCWLSRGLSPLARGTLCRCQHCWRVIRFIPAGAGNTSTLSITTDREPVYPRWRGEHWQNKHRGTRGAGLSPLARGTLDQAVLFFQRRRFIPAGAGNTSRADEKAVNNAVYPRWRGEHTGTYQNMMISGGLSPLARGTRCSVNIDGDVTRFIPAGAGNTFLRLFMRIKNSVYPRWRGEHRRGLTSRPSQTGLSPLARGTPVV